MTHGILSILIHMAVKQIASHEVEAGLGLTATLLSYRFKSWDYRYRVTVL